ncbi:MAG: tetratricopeptide repeat protein [Acidobacteria bacterium]|nr:tetratricopeptide repeat protein [Acidobacteriota bacterium]
MGFFRKELIDPALDAQTRREIEEQQAAIAADPSNPRPYYNLALLYRMQWKKDEALGLLLEAVRLDPAFVPAHVALAEIYVVCGDMAAARRHAEQASALGDQRARGMLSRYSEE